MGKEIKPFNNSQGTTLEWRKVSDQTAVKPTLSSSSQASKIQDAFLGHRGEKLQMCLENPQKLGRLFRPKNLTLNNSKLSSLQSSGDALSASVLIPGLGYILSFAKRLGQDSEGNTRLQATVLFPNLRRLSFELLQSPEGTLKLAEHQAYFENPRTDPKTPVELSLSKTGSDLTFTFLPDRQELTLGILAKTQGSKNYFYLRPKPRKIYPNFRELQGLSSAAFTHTLVHSEITRLSSSSTGVSRQYDLIFSNGDQLILKISVHPTKTETRYSGTAALIPFSQVGPQTPVTLEIGKIGVDRNGTLRISISNQPDQSYASMSIGLDPTLEKKVNAAYLSSSPENKAFVTPVSLALDIDSKMRMNQAHKDSPRTALTFLGSIDELQLTHDNPFVIEGYFKDGNFRLHPSRQRITVFDPENPSLGGRELEVIQYDNMIELKVLNKIGNWETETLYNPAWDSGFKDSSTNLAPGYTAKPILLNPAPAAGTHKWVLADSHELAQVFPNFKVKVYQDERNSEWYRMSMNYDSFHLYFRGVKKKAGTTYELFSCSGNLPIEIIQREGKIYAMTFTFPHRSRELLMPWDHPFTPRQDGNYQASKSPFDISYSDQTLRFVPRSSPYLRLLKSQLPKPDEAEKIEAEQSKLFPDMLRSIMTKIYLPDSLTFLKVSFGDPHRIILLDHENTTIGLQIAHASIDAIPDLNLSQVQAVLDNEVKWRVVLQHLNGETRVLHFESYDGATTLEDLEFDWDLSGRPNLKNFRMQATHFKLELSPNLAQDIEAAVAVTSFEDFLRSLSFTKDVTFDSVLTALNLLEARGKNPYPTLTLELNAISRNFDLFPHFQFTEESKLHLIEMFVQNRLVDQDMWRPTNDILDDWMTRHNDSIRLGSGPSRARKMSLEELNRRIHNETGRAVPGKLRRR